MPLLFFVRLVLFLLVGFSSFGFLYTQIVLIASFYCTTLLIAKLHAYGFSLAALSLVRSYLSNKKQRTKINESYGSWEEILFGVPLGSFLETLLFNIFIYDLFIMIDDINIGSYAVDNTPFVSGDTPLNILNEKHFEWFANSHMKANHDKFHLLMSILRSISIKVKKII